jgi:hypothetical protein
MKISPKFVVSYPYLEPLLMYFDHGNFHFLPLLECDLMQIRFLLDNEQGSHMNT